MDWTIFSSVPTGMGDAADGVLPYVIGIFVLLAGIGLAFRLFGKAGARR